MEHIIIDGAQGEGGGQVLRTSLTLAVLYKKSIEIRNIRSGRKKPGLMRQHLTSVMAAAQVCGAQTHGVELGSTCIQFVPGEVKAGDYHFAIGTAGSTNLVCQTVLPMLLMAKGESTVTFEGGTHNGMSPSLTFLQHSFLPVLALMGQKCDVAVESLGFYPAGGGKWTLRVNPVDTLKPFCLTEPPNPGQRRVTGIVSNLSPSIVEREYAQVVKSLDWHGAPLDRQTPRTQGPGNTLILHAISNTHHSIVEVVGQNGLSAERVAKRAAGKMKVFLASNAAVEEQLADQLLILMLLAEGCEYTTTAPTAHTLTNIKVIEQLTGRRFNCTQMTSVVWRIN